MQVSGFLKGKKGIIQYYFMLATTMVIMGVVSHAIINQTMYGKVVDERKAELDAGVQNLEDKLGLLTQTANGLYYYPDTLSLMGKSRMEASDQVLLRDYQRFLSLTSLTDDWILNYYLYFPRSGLVFDKSRVYMSMSEMYESFSYVESMTQAEFIRKILNSQQRLNPVCAFLSEGKKSRAIPYVQKINGNSNLVLVAMLDMNRVESILNLSVNDFPYDLRVEEKLLYDSELSEALAKKHDLYQREGRRRAGRINNVLLESSSADFGMSVRMMMTSNVLSTVMNRLLRGYVYIVAAVTLVGILVLFVIDRFFNNSNRKMAQRFKEQEYAVKNYHINRLLESYTSDQELQEAVLFLKLDEDKKSVVCIIKDFEKLDIRERLHEILEGLPQTQESHGSMTYIERKVSESVILLYNLDEAETIITAFEKLLKERNLVWESRLYLGVGNSYESARGICVSYMEAKKVMSYHRSYPEVGLVRYTQMPTVSNVVALGLESKNKLQVLMTSNEPEKAVALFKEIFKESSRTDFILNPVAANNFIAQISGILIYSVEELVQDKTEREELLTEVSRLFNLQDNSDFERQVIGLIETVCRYGQNLFRNDKALSVKMLAYMEENYHNPDLSLIQMGELFGMSSGYFSQYFKQNTNKNFSQHLEGVRIGAAVKLLEHSGKSINDIMEEVGYTNRNTFYKAFIRVHGISPKAYKENILKKV